MASDLIHACKVGHLPTIKTMCQFGLLGRNGTNPIALFECYKYAVKSGVTEEELNDAMERGTLNEIVLQNFGNPYHHEVVRGVGIQKNIGE